MYKIQVYLPEEALTSIREAIEKAGGGHIGNYAGCMSWWKVRSSWITLPGAHPYNGEEGKRTEADEYILQFRCDDNLVEKVVNEIKKVHPYEEAVIDVVKLTGIVPAKD